MLGKATQNKLPAETTISYSVQAHNEKENKRRVENDDVCRQTQTQLEEGKQLVFYILLITVSEGYAASESERLKSLGHAGARYKNQAPFRP